MATTCERTHSSRLIYLHPFFWARSSLEGAIGKSPLRFAQPLLPKSFEYLRRNLVLGLLVRGAVLGQPAHAALVSVRSYVVPSKLAAWAKKRGAQQSRGEGRVSDAVRKSPFVGHVLRFFSSRV